MTYPAVYALLRERMADEFDIPDTDDVIEAALKAAIDAVAAVVRCPIAGHFGDGGCGYDAERTLAAIDALRGES